MKKRLFSGLFSLLFFSAFAQPVPFNGCPDVNLAILRSGNNNSTNPLSIYNINTTTGTPTLLSGPILNPANNTTNLHVNGLGLNTTDGFLYGLSSNITAVLTTNTSLPFYRIGANAVALQTGCMPVPLLTGTENQSVINAAAGEIDQSDKYYFTAATGTLNSLASSFQFNRLFLGILPSVSTLAASVNMLSPSYIQITSTDINCADFLSSLTAVFNGVNISNATNTGFKDFVFDKFSGSLYSYVTYPSQSNSATFMGLMVKLDPSTGLLTAIAPPSISSVASITNDVSGTLLDKNGNFLVLFTDGIIYKASTVSPGVFNGAITILNNNTGLPNPLRGDMASCGNGLIPVNPTPFTGCPGTNLAILRFGDNSSTGPVSIYNLNTLTGTPTLLPGGPILDPADNTSNLQINGLGLNTTDGFLYGIGANPTNLLSPNTAQPFYRLGANSVALQTGNMPGPLRSGGENESVVNAAAGEMDPSGNYYFTAATGTLNNTTLNFQFNRFFIGILPSVSTLVASTSAVLSPSYIQITSTDNNCTDYLASLTAVFTAAIISNASNTGFKDLVYDKLSGNLYSYVTYPSPSNPAVFMGLMVKLNPLPGILTAVAPTSVSSVASITTDVSGTLLDKNGNFLILFTNGEIYKANTIAPATFDGSISPLNLTTGLPSPLRGDLASCGAGLLLPITLNYFTAYGQNNTAILKWETASEINAEKFVVERSADAISWTDIQTIAAAGNSSSTLQYSYTDKNITGKDSFYRLKFVDMDGTVKYSTVKKVSFSTANISLSYYPTPVKNILYAERSASFSNNVQVKISNIAGTIYNTAFKKIDANKLAVDLSLFPPGIYLLQIIDGDGSNTVQKIIKQ